MFKTSGFDASQTTENWFLFFGVISPGVALYGAANIVHCWMTNDSNDSNDPNDPNDPNDLPSARDQAR